MSPNSAASGVALPHGRSAAAVRDALTARAQTLPAQLRRSLTWDQGRELAEHVHFTVDTGVAVYERFQAGWHRGPARSYPITHSSPRRAPRCEVHLTTGIHCDGGERAAGVAAGSLELAYLVPARPIAVDGVRGYLDQGDALINAQYDLSVALIDSDLTASYLAAEDLEQSAIAALAALEEDLPEPCISANWEADHALVMNLHAAGCYFGSLTGRLL